MQKVIGSSSAKERTPCLGSTESENWMTVTQLGQPPLLFHAIQCRVQGRQICRAWEDEVTQSSISRSLAETRQPSEEAEDCLPDPLLRNGMVTQKGKLCCCGARDNITTVALCFPEGLSVLHKGHLLSPTHRAWNWGTEVNWFIQDPRGHWQSWAPVQLQSLPQVNAWEDKQHLLILGLNLVLLLHQI